MASFLEAEVAAVLGGGDVMWLIHLFADQESAKLGLALIGPTT